MCYINDTKDFKFTGFVGDGPEKLKLRLYVDADFAGDRLDAKSTSGALLVLVGPNTYYPLQWSSRKQTSVSRSTTESEVVSLAAGLYGDALPMMSLFDLLLDKDCELEVLEDNQATITVIRKGYSSKLRHVSRTHKVNLASLSEAIKADGVSLQYVESKKQAADIFTKALSPGLWGAALKMLCVGKESIQSLYRFMCAAL